MDRLVLNEYQNLCLEDLQFLLNGIHQAIVGQNKALIHDGIISGALVSLGLNEISIAAGKAVINGHFVDIAATTLPKLPGYICVSLEDKIISVRKNPVTGRSDNICVAVVAKVELSPTPSGLVLAAYTQVGEFVTLPATAKFNISTAG